MQWENVCKEAHQMLILGILWEWKGSSFSLVKILLNIHMEKCASYQGTAGCFCTSANTEDSPSRGIPPPRVAATLASNTERQFCLSELSNDHGEVEGLASCL